MTLPCPLFRKIEFYRLLLEAQLLCNLITGHRLTRSLTQGRLAFSMISPLFVDQFLYGYDKDNFIKRPFLLVAGVKMPIIGGGLNFK